MTYEQRKQERQALIDHLMTKTGMYLAHSSL